MAMRFHSLADIGRHCLARGYETDRTIDGFVDSICSNDIINRGISLATLKSIDRLQTSLSRIELLIERHVKARASTPSDPVSVGVASWVVFHQTGIAERSDMIPDGPETLGELACKHLGVRARKAIIRKGLGDRPRSELDSVPFSDWEGMVNVGPTTLAELADFGDRLGVQHNFRPIANNHKTD